MKEKLFPTEAGLVAKFCELLERENSRAFAEWTIYHETGGWDLLLVHRETGVQIGVEAKLSLNAKVLEQALPGAWADDRGPDFRAVLVPAETLQNHLHAICRHLGVVVWSISGQPGWKPGSYHYQLSPQWLPDPQAGDLWAQKNWPNWAPAERCALPDYVPDVTGGCAAPVQLTHWKIKAIKLLIILERRGYVTRLDMKALQISQSRWTDHWNGFLGVGANGYVRNGRTPDLKAQHPVNWAQIEADIGVWSKALDLGAQQELGLGVAAE